MDIWAENMDILESIVKKRDISSVDEEELAEANRAEGILTLASGNSALLRRFPRRQHLPACCAGCFSLVVGLIVLGFTVLVEILKSDIEARYE